MQAEYFALEGLSALTATIEKVKAAYNPHLTIDGVIFTMFDGRMNLANQVRAEVAKHFGDKVLETTVPRNVRLSEAPSHGKPVMLYDLRCPGSKSYLAVADEFLERTHVQELAASKVSPSMMSPDQKPGMKRGLGRGLSALLPTPGTLPARTEIPPSKRTYFSAQSNRSIRGRSSRATTSTRPSSSSLPTRSRPTASSPR